MSQGFRESASEDRSVVVIGLMSRVFGLDLATGERRFEHYVGAGSGEVELLVHRERIYACADGKHLFVYHYPSGVQQRQVDLPFEWGYGNRPTMLLEGERLIVCAGGAVACLNLDGDVLWLDLMKGKGVACASIALPDNTRQADQK